MLTSRRRAISFRFLREGGFRIPKRRVLLALRERTVVDEDDTESADESRSTFGVITLLFSETFSSPRSLLQAELVSASARSTYNSLI